MNDTAHAVPCRLAACRESLGDGREWSFYLLNDGDAPLDVVVKSFGHEWGDYGGVVHPGVVVTGVPAGGHARIWRGDDDEFRMWLALVVRTGDREVDLLFEFPLLHRRRALPVVAGPDLPGLVISAVS